jgi:superoxide reductase
MKIYICQVCGHIAFNNLQDKCPVCGAEKDKFLQNDAIFKESIQKSPEAEIKHVPVIAVNDESCSLIPEFSCMDLVVRIGKVMHPMEEKHYIRFIDAYQNDKFIARMELTPLSVYPAACFHLKEAGGKITIVENCSIHGYWKSEI